MKRAPRLGEFLITKTGQVGLCVFYRGDGLRPHVYLQFANNGPWRRRDQRNVWPASREEIKTAGLEGVGCLDPMDDAP